MPPGRLGNRIGQYVLVLWVALTLNFLLTRVAPGDPINYLLGDEVNALTPEQREQVLSQYGLDEPLLVQYGMYWVNVARFELGTSVRFGQPVADVLIDRLPWTLLLVGCATVLSTFIGITAGTIAAWKRGSARDTGLMVGILSLEAMPGFWIGMILISVFSVTLGLFPTYGAVSLVSLDGLAHVWDVARHLVLPVIAITLATSGSVFLLSRASMLTTLGEDYTTMAEAKGVSERGVVFRHALRNALLPVYTNFTLSLGTLVSGAVVIETVFAYPGLGRLIYEGVLARDYPLLQGAFLLVTVGVISANLLADLTYPLLDPRVRRPGANR
ncbi:ABC transporter permease [Rubrobacter taiwanensis]|uniref:ABC transporter permease n=1 Tax=Rubrobacter taiwanensis TaxID=185139 RepID=A0A4R1BHX1_9ACTN|nr:ABC transporter permease [Rubrobacter taiwanensis]TCJ16728.1 ABC transporter permease [Rubrobacter taiwanensis]